MPKFLLVVAMLMLVALPLAAQDQIKADVFGGYQFTHISYGNPVSIPGINNADNFNGWNAALTVWAKQWLGITGDFSGAYKSNAFVSNSGVDVHQYTFMFGPTIASHKNEKFVPFAHALFGAATCGTNQPIKDCFGTDSSAFAFAIGGGLDWGVGKRWAVRVGQFDYLRTHFGGSVGQNAQNEFRYSAGIVVKF